ncbi:hypothetical protein Fot_37500 [Forsythia ovata]|uniref:Uncharacterized protein n=1 Tax=Forsythia ovata TaxID=205694 RepID=A0ABD1RZ54_9LAMI
MGCWRRLSRRKKKLEDKMSMREGQARTLYTELVGLRQKVTPTEMEVSKQEANREETKAKVAKAIIKAVVEYKAIFHHTSDYKTIVEYFRGATVKEVRKLIQMKHPEP